MVTKMEPRPPVQPGESAPDFTLPSVDRGGTVSLDDYRGKNALLLCLFRGLWCPFCRRAIARLGATQAKLKEFGVETLGVVATTPENARLYFRLRPTKVALAADPELTTHWSYGVPKPDLTPEFMEDFGAARVDPTGELPEPAPIEAAIGALDGIDGFHATETDRSDQNSQFPQLKGQFLLDRNGIVRWVNIEGAVEGPNGIGKFPSDEDFLAAVRTLDA